MKVYRAIAFLSVILISGLALDLQLFFSFITTGLQRTIIMSILGCLGGFLILINLKKSIQFIFYPVICLYLLYTVWLLLSILWTIDINNTINSTGGMVLMVIFAIGASQLNYKSVAYFWKYTVFTICILCWAYYFINPYDALHFESFFRIKGITSHAQQLVLLSGSALIITLIDLKYVSSIQQKYFNYFILFIFTVTIIATNTRAWTTYLFVTITMYYLIHKRFSNVKIATISFLSIFIIFFLNYAISIYYMRTGYDFQNLTGRIPLWEYSFYLFKNNPIFGYGFASFGRDYLLVIIQGWEVGHAHNMLLQVAVETGVIGLSLFLIFIVVSIKQAVYTYKYFRQDRLSQYNFYILIFVLLCGLTGVVLGANVRTLYILTLFFIFQNQRLYKTVHKTKILR